MIDAMIEACTGIVDFASGGKRRRGSGVSRLGLSNGFFINNLLWFGDVVSRKTAISRGVTVRPGEINRFTGRQLKSRHGKVRIMLGGSGQEYQLQGPGD